MSKSPKLVPPPVSTTPSQVLIEWIDATDEDYTGPLDAAGGLVRLPLIGYHIRTVLRSPHGPFCVFADEIEPSPSGFTCRGVTSIPLGWIKQWSVIRTVEQIYPPQESI